jgi:hypothetical protein
MAKHFDFNNPFIDIHPMSRRQVDLFNEASHKAISQIDNNKLGLIATIGSSTADFKAYDIDQIISPNLNTKPGEALLEAMNYYRIVNTYLKEKGHYLALCPKFAYQEYVYEVVAQNNSGYDNQIKLHNMFFTDIKNIISVADSDFFSKLNPNNFVIQHGSVDNLTGRRVVEPEALENYFTVAESLIGYDNNLPEHLSLGIAFKKFAYLMKHTEPEISLQEMNQLRCESQVQELTRRYLLSQDAKFN